ncbi:hypothetical protein B6U91_01445 [Candidatus Pacearchaeota archaeon ex4484_71]|nr:MAG: hypothetical protein B6U91_01445 [Candidatus Pacearchaeota archaeon ex4484_71]
MNEETIRNEFVKAATKDRHPELSGMERPPVVGKVIYGIEARIYSEDLKKLVEGNLNTLPEREQLILRKRMFEELSIAELRRENLPGWATLLKEKSGRGEVPEVLMKVVGEGIKTFEED